MEGRRFFLGQVVDGILDAVFPRFCVSCKKEGGLLCFACFSSFDDFVFRVEENHLTMFAYGNPVIRDLIKAYKYDFDHSALKMLQRLASTHTDKIKAFLGESVLVPIPLSVMRLRERGFNQSEEIGKWLAQETGRPMKGILSRKEKSGHQADRSVDERIRAMQESPFTIKKDCRGENICIIDDVWTTGSTMKAAEKTLKEGGARSVIFLTIAKG